MTANAGLRVALRVDASAAIGTGHLMRCLTLADRLSERGAECRFLCADHDGVATRLVERYRVERLPAAVALNAGGPAGEALAVARRRDVEESLGRLDAFRPDAVVVDHYRLDASWERPVRRRFGRLMVIDDLADRDHDCDLLLDQNLYQSPERRYLRRLSPGCRQLLGPDYALLRPAFRAERAAGRRRDGRVGRIQLFFGGTDPTGETIKALRALDGMAGVALEVIAGVVNPRLDELRELCDQRPSVALSVQVDDMARRMGEADLAVGAVGAAYLERCAVGLPTVGVVTAENQREVAGVLGRRGAIESLGWHEGVTERAIREAVERLSAEPEAVAGLAWRSAAVMDGWFRGGEDRLLDALMERPINP